MANLVYCCVFFAVNFAAGCFDKYNLIFLVLLLLKQINKQTI